MLTLSARFIRHGLELRGVTIEIIKGEGIEELPPPEIGTVDRTETRFVTDAVPMLDNARELVLDKVQGFIAR